jgi:acetate kinase
MPAPANILVANIGSTSLKVRLFEMPSERVLAKAGIERIGSAESPWTVTAPGGGPRSGTGVFPDHAAALRFLDAELGGFAGLAAVGFKPVMARGISGTQFMTAPVLRAMEEFNTLMPAHNPPYIAGVRLFNQMYPGLPCIGTFETAFYDHLPPATYRFPVPLEWEEKYGVRRYGFHGASHRYITDRCAELRGTSQLRIISCHLGGSSSIAAVVNGSAVNSSWGMTAQSGLPQNNRAGDFDCFALIYLARDLGLGLDAVEKALSTQSGLKGMSGLPSGDVRDLLQAARQGNDNARTALEVFTAQIRKFIGQFLVEMNGADVLVFTAGIAENNPCLRAAICAGLDFCGLRLDAAANEAARAGEAVISTPDSKIEVRVIPTNEELVIARNAWKTLQQATQEQTRPISVSR